MLPFFRATLVNPPVVTYVDLPVKINGLKSKCLGSMLSGVIVGTVERISNGWAI